MYVGRWDRTSHGISGSVSYDTPTRLSLNDFYYDGTGIGMYLVSSLSNIVNFNE